MLSLRNLARAAPRAATRLTATPVLARATLLKTALRTSSFSTARVMRAAAATGGETDAELSAKLESEISFEDEVAKEEQMPTSIKDFIDQGEFEVVDIEGREEVRLVRNYGDEK